MSRYSYSCLNKEGQELQGIIEAASDESARIKLMEQGLKILRVDLLLSENDIDAGKSARREIENFECVQLSDFGKAAWYSESEYVSDLPNFSQPEILGIPLSASFLTLAEETSSRKLSRIFQNIANDLEQGIPPEDCFGRNLNSIPHHLESLILAGAQTKHLESIIEDYIESQRYLAQSRHKIQISLFYSGVLIAASFLLLYFLMVTVVASFESIFEGFGTELPSLTVLAFQISDLLSEHGLQILGWFLLLSVAFWFGFDLFKLQPVRRRLINKIPVFGGILSNTSYAQFCRMLATMTEAKIYLPDAIELSAKTTNDPNLIAGCQVLKSRMKEGLSLSETSSGIPQFSKSFIHIFRWQDRPDIFIDSLRASSNIFQAKANMKTGSLVFALQPIILAGILIIITFPIGAIYLPLIKLLNDLS
ncbi:type II secretion system F family protein [Gimesia sp.]|uniref:type II secretion system F family protein n=1 Tax=Gimesia sp. TaxID=2024833 RepID=UPI003A93D14E